MADGCADGYADTQIDANMPRYAERRRDCGWACRQRVDEEADRLALTLDILKNAQTDTFRRDSQMDIH